MTNFVRGALGAAAAGFDSPVLAFAGQRFLLAARRFSPLAAAVSSLFQADYKPP